MASAEYALLCAWFTISLVPLQYYVGIIGYQLERLGGHGSDDEQEPREPTAVYTRLFSYCFAGAAVTAPLAGWIADRCGLGIAQGLATAVVSVPFWFLACSESSSSFCGGTPSSQVPGFVAYGIGRMGVFGLFFSNCGKRFGYANYGTLAGFGLMTSALLSLLQYPLIAWTVRGGSDDDDERSSIVAINLLLGSLLLLQLPYFVWLHKREKKEEASSRAT